MNLQLMFDSATPGDALALPQPTLVAPYRDGKYAWSAALLAHFSHVRQLGITVTGDPAWPVLDWERGCCSTRAVVAAVHARRAAGLASIIYCCRSSWGTCWGELELAGLVEAPSWWWIAEWGHLQPPTELPQQLLMTREGALTVTALGQQFCRCAGYDLSVVDMDRLPPDL